jgi:hypothetical protein
VAQQAHDVSRSPGDDDRLAAALHGEVAATTVEAYRRAGASAYQDMMDAEQLRGSLAASGAWLWAASTGQSSQLLRAWNAFALQTLGDELVEADYRAEPRTAGFLPRSPPSRRPRSSARWGTGRPAPAAPPATPATMWPPRSQCPRRCPPG